MAYATITSTATAISVDYGVYAGSVTPFGTVPSMKTYQKKNIEVGIVSNIVYLWINSIGQQVPTSYDGSVGTYKIDSINGVVPVSNLDLYTLFKNIL